VEIPPARAGGGSGTISRKKLLEETRIDPSHFRIAVLDLESIALFRRSRMDFDMEMPPPEGVIEPLNRGLNVIAVGTPFSISRVLRMMESSSGNENIERLTLAPK
jgi:predicted transcriptional regulator